MTSWKGKSECGQSQVQVLKLLPEDETTNLGNGKVIISNYVSSVFFKVKGNNLMPQVDCTKRRKFWYRDQLTVEHFKEF